jgi:Tfp pilus assembly major pilin PilA
LLVALLLAAALAACGGGGGSGSAAPVSTQAASTTSATIPGGGVTNSGGILLATPTTVQVGANQSTTDVDIQVPGTASTINGMTVAISAPHASQPASNGSGAGVNPGSQYWLWVTGTNITSSLTLAIGGPSDITNNGVAGNVLDGTTHAKIGVLYTITVAAGAAPGARTITLTDSNSNVTTLAGALEVCSAANPSC